MRVIAHLWAAAIWCASIFSIEFAARAVSAASSAVSNLEKSRSYS